MGKGKPIEAVALALVQKQLDEQDKLKGPYEKALGRLSIRFSLLHVTLEQFSWEVWGVEPRFGSIITKDLRTSHLVEKLIASTDLAVVWEKDRKELKSILKKIRRLAEERNELLHSLWIIQNDKPVLCISKKRGRLVGPDAPSVEEINDLTHGSMEILGELMKFEGSRLKGLFGLGLGLEIKNGG
jgi:hypothetical protein